MKVTVDKFGIACQHVAEAVIIGTGILCQDLFSCNTHRGGEALVACYKLLQFVTGILYSELSFVLLGAADYWTFSKTFGSKT